MAALGSVSITGSVTGFPTGSKSFNFALTSSNAVGTIMDMVLAPGDNTVPIPTGATMVFIDPPAANTAVMRLKGIAGDTGFELHPTAVTFLPIASDVTSLIINASAQTPAPVEFSFI